MRAGQRNVRVELQSPPTGATGQVDSAWLTYATAWAAIETASDAGTGVTVTIPYQRGVEPFHRIRARGRVLDVGQVRNLGERNRDLELLCEEPETPIAATMQSYTETYDPATGTNTRTPADTPMQITVLSYTTEEIDGALIQQGDLKVLVPAWGLARAPTTAESLMFDGQEWSVESVTPEYASGRVRRYVLQVRR